MSNKNKNKNKPKYDPKNPTGSQIIPPKFSLLNKIINQKPEMLEQIQIIDEQKKNYTITEFLDIVEKWKIKA